MQKRKRSKVSSEYKAENVQGHGSVQKWIVCLAEARRLKDRKNHNPLQASRMSRTSIFPTLVYL